jgi:hypothetical protein
VKRAGLSSIKFPTLRFRAKIMLGFAVTLAISAASMGFAYLGFERVSGGVDSYRRSVLEADLARNIDRELISYRSLARYFVATGKEEDGKAALAAEGSLKEAILASMKGTTNPARLEQIVKLERESSRSRTRAPRSRRISWRAPAPPCATSSTISPATPTTPNSR